jgi:hypothetical protein
MLGNPRHASPFTRNFLSISKDITSFSPVFRPRPIKKRMDGKVVVLVAVVIRDFAMVTNPTSDAIREVHFPYCINPTDVLYFAP